MKILVNGYNLRQTSTGIANVIINAVNALAEHIDVSVILVASSVISEEIKSRLSKKVKLEVIGGRNSLKWLMLDFPKYVRFFKADLLWTPTPLLPKSVFKVGMRVLVTVNDFVSIEYRNTMTLKGRLITLFLEKRTIKKADYLWCISKYTKSKLEEYYPRRRCKNVFVGCAPDSSIKQIELDAERRGEFLHKFNIQKPFLLFVGSLEPRKNLFFLLQVFKEFHKTQDIQLVIVGARSWGRTKLSEIINATDYPKNDVIFTPFISETELMTLYSLATCYVSTSRNEGFGLPQAEAMICGCPVVTAHNSAMIEVVENYGITVKGWNIGDWVSAISYAIAHKSEIVEKQKIKANTFSWTEIISSLCEYLVLRKNS